MDVKYINPFVAAARTVFTTMLGIDLALGKPIIKGTRNASADLTGIMSLVGDKKGTIAISLSKRGALFIFNSLIGDTSTSLGPEVVDAIGELTNIISGQARKEFENTGLNLKASIPMVVMGTDVETSFITQLPIVSLPFYFSVNGGAPESQEVMFLDFSFE
jgi:chemotaxis protein CheX